MTQEISTARQAGETLKEKITERIRAQFVELVPDETWREMVKVEIDAYLTPREQNSFHSGRDYLTPMQCDIREALKQLGKDAIKKALSDEKWINQNAPNGDWIASEIVTKIVTENASKIVADVYGSLVQDVVNRIRNGNI